MKFNAIILLGVLGLSACTEYQGLEANCFEGDTVTRSANNFMSISASDVVLSTKNATTNNCTFEPLAGAGGQ